MWLWLGSPATQIIRTKFVYGETLASLVGMKPLWNFLGKASVDKQAWKRASSYSWYLQTFVVSIEIWYIRMPWLLETLFECSCIIITKRNDDWKQNKLKFTLFVAAVMFDVTV